MSKKVRAYIFVVLGAASWGFIGVFNRMLIAAGCSTANSVVFRNTGSLILLTVLFGLFHRQVFFIQKKHLPIFLGSGIVGLVGMGWTYYICQKLCSLAVAGILLYLAPAFVVFGSALLWKAPLTKRKISAVALSMIGCAFVSGIAGGFSTSSTFGIIMGIGSGLCYASYTLFAHYGLEHYDSFTVIYWTFVIAGIVSLVFLHPVTAVETLSKTQGVIGAVGIIVVGTVLPYVLYTKGLEEVESGTASVIASAEPVTAALAGVVFYQERLDGWTILGIVLVLAAACILAKSEKDNAHSVSGIEES